MKTFYVWVIPPSHSKNLLALVKVQILEPSGRVLPKWLHLCPSGFRKFTCVSAQISRNISMTCLLDSRAQHRIIEVSQIFVGSALAMEMSVKYLKVTISFTKKSVKFSSVFILPRECPLFLGFRQYERKTVKFTARLAWTTIFNKIRQVFSFRSCHLPRLCSSQGQISYKKALEP